MRQLLKYTKIKHKELLLKHLYSNITICSDGGAKDGIGSFGIINRIQGINVIEFHNRIPKSYENANSYRSEAMGILVTVKLLELVHIYSQSMPHPHRIHIICDNEAVVNSINKLRNKKPTLRQHYYSNMDVSRAIFIHLRYLKKRWHCSVLVHHVRGHQNEHKKILLPDEQLNTEADKLATNGLSKKKVENLNLPGDRIKLFVNDQQVTSHFTRTLRNNFHSFEMYKYFQEKYNWTSLSMEQIWWEVHGKALKRTTIQKFLHERLPCNYREN
jgi:ribonuclease HI